ncbi:hypothetical protein JCM10213_004302 [Rhodosporidiobolus nylandii]
MGKGFVVTNQKVSVSVGLNGRINGYTELTLTPTSSDLRTVWLNASRSLSILSCSLRLPTVVPLGFSHLAPAVPALTQKDNIHTYPEMKRQIWRADNEGEEGELGIAVPQACIVKIGGGVARTPAPPTPAPGKKGKGKEEEPQLPPEEFEPFTIAVEYEAAKPGIGLVVVGPDEANPSRFPHVFTSAVSDVGARTWVPCIDHPRERCSWDLELVVPRVLSSAPPANARRKRGGSAAPAANGAAAEEDEDEDEEEEEDVDAEWPITVAASGELVEQVVHPDRSDRVIWHFVQVSPVSVQQVAWAVGPFSVTEIKGTTKFGSGVGGAKKEGEEDDDDDGEGRDDGPSLHALCLPGREAEMEYSVGVIRQSMDFYTATFGSYPFVTYTVCFVDSLASGSPTFHSAGLTLVSSDVLHPPSVIDQAYETRHLLAHALAVQWAGVNLVPRTASDSWLAIGIALHMTSLFVKHLWGTNEYRFRLKKDMTRCVEQDIQFEPICVPARLTIPEPAQMQFIALKAPLVLHILDKHLRKAGTSLGLDKVLPKLFLDAMTGELASASAGTGNTLSTTSFMRTCRKACGVSSDALRLFFDQWVYGSGCPTFEISANFNRKKMAVELNVSQRCYAYAWAQKAPWEAQGHLRPIPLFDGQMTIRIHEADGTPYEHVLSLGDAFKRHEVPFNTKYKRVRRNTKRYQARQAAATAAALGDADAQEDLGLIDVGFSLGMWEDEAERERWRVADWTEEDDAVMSQATYEWIRIDADLEWIAIVRFTQPDFMWISQLQRDRDVIAQLEAIHALSSMPSLVVSSNLCKTVLVNNYFVRIRMEAALALITCATPDQQYLGLFHLFKLFQTWYCFEPDVETQDAFGFRCIPKTNDFGDFTMYFLKKTLVTAISMVRDDKGQTPPVIQQFLVDLLAYNDNLGNKYSDAHYITTVMHSLAHALVKVLPQDQPQFGGGEMDQLAEIDANENLAPAVLEVERYLSADRLVPSYHNVVTVAGIEFMLKLTMASLIPEDRMRFFVYTRDGNYPPVRIAAFDALLLLNPLQDVHALTRYLFAVMRDDSSRLVQRQLAQSVLESLPILAALHDLAAPDPAAEEGKEAKRDELSNVLKSLRKKPGRSMNYRTALLQTLTHPDVDPEVRLCCLKICEATVRPEGEPLPKMRFRLPPPPPPAPAPVEQPPTPSGTITKIKIGGALGASTPKITIPATPSAQPEYAMPAPVLPVSAPPPHPAAHEPLDYYDQNFAPPPPPPVVKPPKPKKEKDPNRPPKPPKALKQDAAMASGMGHGDVTACRSLIKKLMKDKKSFIFRAPVDPIKAGAPDYWDKITNPMDLGTMKGKLEAGQYPDRYAFRDDFKLMIANAKLYNGAASPIGQLADDLDQIFEKHWQRVQATLHQLELNAQTYAQAAPLPAIPTAPAYQPSPAPVATPIAATPLPPLPPAASLPPQPAPAHAPPPPAPTSHTAPPPLPQLPKPAERVVPPPPAPLNPSHPRPTPPPPAPLPPTPTLSIKLNRPAAPAPAPIATPAALPALPPLAATPSAAPSATASPAPPIPTPAAALPALPKQASPPPPPKPSGFKIKLGGASVTAGSTPKPPKQASFSPDVSYSPAATPYQPAPSTFATPTLPSASASPAPSAASFDYNPYSPAAWSAGGAPPPKEKKKKKDKPPKPSAPPMVSSNSGRKIPNYVEPTEDEFDDPDAVVEVNAPVAASFAYTVPQRPEVLDTPAPLPPTRWVNPQERVDIAKAKSVLAKVRGIREAFFFQYPVEAVGPLATYYDEIPHPMDLQTLSNNLDRGKYATYDQLFNAFNLIISNCERFNTPNTEPIWHAHMLDRAWRTEWEKASKLPYNTKRSLSAFMKRLMDEGVSQPFNVPIAELVAMVPNYHQFIPPENARDMVMLRRNIEADKYQTIEALEADFDLMIRNCYTFNGTESHVSYSAKELNEKFKKGILRIKTDSQKQAKRGSSSIGGGPSKKQKF